MNNKGQTLVLFLFLIPVVFLLFMGIYQVGTVALEKKKLEDSVETIVKYGIDHWSEEEVEAKMKSMLVNDFSKITQENIEIELETGRVKMTVTKEYNILFLKKQKIKVSYVGTNIEGKVQVVKE